MEVRSGKTLDIFGQAKSEVAPSQTDGKQKVLSGLEKLKAKRISK